MDKIKLMSMYVKKVLWALLFLVPFAGAFQWMMISLYSGRGQVSVFLKFFDGIVSVPEGVVSFMTLRWTSLGLVFGFISEMVSLFPIVLGLIVLKGLFSQYSQGKVFSLDNAKKFKSLGVLIFLDALFAQPMSNMLKVLGVTLSNGVGHRYITLQFGTINLYTLFVGFMLMVISWVMCEASRLYEEQKYTV